MVLFRSLSRWKSYHKNWERSWTGNRIIIRFFNCCASLSLASWDVLPSCWRCFIWNDESECKSRIIRSSHFRHGAAYQDRFSYAVCLPNTFRCYLCCISLSHISENCARLENQLFEWRLRKSSEIAPPRFSWNESRVWRSGYPGRASVSILDRTSLTLECQRP